MPKSLRGSPKKKFILALSGLLLCAFFFTSWFSYQVAYRSLSEQIQTNHLPLTSDTVYSEIQQDLLQPIFISSLMAQDTFVRDWALQNEHTPEPMIRYLSAIQQRYQAVTSFFVSSKTLHYYHPRGILKTLSANNPDDAWYFRVSQLPPTQDYETNIDNDTADTSRTTVFVNYKVFDYEHNLIGVTGVGLNVELVKSLISRYQQRYLRSIYFIDLQGNLTLTGENYSGPHNIYQRPGLADLAKTLLTNPSGRYQFMQEQQRVYLNARYIPEFNWYLMVEQQDDAAAAGQLKQALWLNLLISTLVTLTVLLIANFTLGSYQRRLETLASTDKLTGAFNRQSFETQLEQVLEIQHRSNSPCCLIIFDVDHFKQVNDQYGHLVGDEALKQIVSLATQQLRSSDIICRWGGEEFVVLLANCDATAAFAVAEKIRLSIAHNTVQVDQHQLKLSISCGLAQAKKHEVFITQLINRADQAMYQAKRNGRNRSIITP